MKTLSILLADDHRLVRQGLRYLLELHPGFKVVAEVANGAEAVEAVRQAPPDIALLDIMMPVLNGLDATRRISQMKVKTQIIILSMHTSATYAVRALRNGAAGYVLKDADEEEIIQAILDVSQGRRYISRTIADEVLSALLDPESTQANLYESLSHRERQVLQMIAEGMANAAMAYRLSISERTVENHRASMMRKLNLRSPAELVRFAIQQGIIAVNDVGKKTE